MKWGAFEYPDEIHVAPVGEDGYMAGHIDDVMCFCGPDIEDVGDRLMVAHKEDS